MGRLLLAIDGCVPHQWTIRYTVQLCKSLHARLQVLCMLPRDSAGCADGITPQFENQGIPCSIEKRIGNPTTEIVNYLKMHHEIDLAIYDISDNTDTAGMRAARPLPESLLRAVGVPMVMLRPQRKFFGHRFLKIIRRGIKEVTRMVKVFGKFKRKAPLEIEATPNPGEAAAPEAEKPAKLVVVGQESRFSDAIINYALDMARRMDYRILALNTAPLSCETFRLFSSSRTHVCKEFEALSQKNALGFKERCEAAGIDFSHVVKFVETNEALEQLKAEFDDIGFIVSEPEERPTQAREIMDEQRPEAPMRVYSVI